MGFEMLPVENKRPRRIRQGQLSTENPQSLDVLLALWGVTSRVFFSGGHVVQRCGGFPDRLFLLFTGAPLAGKMRKAFEIKTFQFVCKCNGGLEMRADTYTIGAEVPGI